MPAARRSIPGRAPFVRYRVRCCRNPSNGSRPPGTLTAPCGPGAAASPPGRSTSTTATPSSSPACATSSPGRSRRNPSACSRFTPQDRPGRFQPSNARAPMRSSVGPPCRYAASSRSAPAAAARPRPAPSRRPGPRTCRGRTRTADHACGRVPPPSPEPRGPSCVRAVAPRRDQRTGARQFPLLGEQPALAVAEHRHLARAPALGRRALDGETVAAVRVRRREVDRLPAAQAELRLRPP